MISLYPHLTIFTFRVFNISITPLYLLFVSSFFVHCFRSILISVYFYYKNLQLILFNYIFFFIPLFSSHVRVHKPYTLIFIIGYTPSGTTLLYYTIYPLFIVLLSSYMPPRVNTFTFLFIKYIWKWQYLIPFYYISFFIIFINWGLHSRVLMFSSYNARRGTYKQIKCPLGQMIGWYLLVSMPCLRQSLWPSGTYYYYGLSCFQVSMVRVSL